MNYRTRNETFLREACRHTRNVWHSTALESGTQIKLSLPVFGKRVIWIICMPLSFWNAVVKRNIQFTWLFLYSELYIYRVFLKSLYKILTGIGHIPRVRNCIGTHVPKRHLNLLQTLCFSIFFKRCGVAFECWIFNKYFYSQMFIQTIIQIKIDVF